MNLLQFLILIHILQIKRSNCEPHDEYSTTGPTAYLNYPLYKEQNLQYSPYKPANLQYPSYQQPIYPPYITISSQSAQKDLYSQQMSDYNLKMIEHKKNLEIYNAQLEQHKIKQQNAQTAPQQDAFQNEAQLNLLYNPQIEAYNNQILAQYTLYQIG